VQASYAKVQHLQGTFAQRTFNATFGKETESRGKLYLARPDRMRWDYVDNKDKPKRSMIFDGKTLWGVEPANQKVYKHTVVDATLPAAISFLNGGKLDAKFKVSSPSADTLELVPKQADAGIKKLTFVIDPKTKRVVKSIVVNHNDDTNTFQFAMVEKATNPKTYEFSPKSTPTYDVVELK
jgi:chaperone LolA